MKFNFTSVCRFAFYASAILAVVLTELSRLTWRVQLIQQNIANADTNCHVTKYVKSRLTDIL